MRKTIAALAASTAAVTLGLAGAANAEPYAVDDPRDTSHGSDIVALQVRNGLENLNVITTHVNLRRDPASGSGGAIYLDTDESDPGPEFVLVGGYYVGTDYQLLATEDFGRQNWGAAVQHGDYIMRVGYESEQVRVHISQAALGNPESVRVSVRASGTRTDGSSKGLVDWVGAPRSFSQWVAAG